MSNIEKYFGQIQRSTKPSWIASHGKLSARAWISGLKRKHDFELDYTEFGFLKRTVSFSIDHAERGTVAYGDLEIWRGTYRNADAEEVFPSLEGFVEFNDMISQDAYNNASAIAELWNDDDDPFSDKPFAYGDLVIFKRMASDAKDSADVEAVWHLVNKLLQHLERSSGNNRTSAIVLKAFPLEYEGNVENQKKFKRRQNALMRHYQQRMKLQPVPHPSLAKEGWMLKLINEGAAPPQRRRKRARRESGTISPQPKAR